MDIYIHFRDEGKIAEFDNFSTFFTGRFRSSPGAAFPQNQVFSMRKVKMVIRV